MKTTSHMYPELPSKDAAKVLLEALLKLFPESQGMKTTKTGFRMGGLGAFNLLRRGLGGLGMEDLGDFKDLDRRPVPDTRSRWG